MNHSVIAMYLDSRFIPAEHGDKVTLCAIEAGGARYLTRRVNDFMLSALGVYRPDGTLKMIADGEKYRADEMISRHLQHEARKMIH